MPSKKRKGTPSTVGNSSNTISTSDAKRKKLESEDEAKKSFKTHQDANKSKRGGKPDEKRIRVSQRKSKASSASSPLVKEKPGRKGKQKSDAEDKKQSDAESSKIQPSPSSQSSNKATKQEPARMKQTMRYSKQSDLEFNESKKRKSRLHENKTDQDSNIQRTRSRKKKKNLKRKSKLKQGSSDETALENVGQAVEEGRRTEEVTAHISSDDDSGSFSNEGRSLSHNMKSISCSTDLQTWPEVPSIAHFCSLFRQAFDLLEFDIQELEESLLLMGTEDDTTQLVLRLVIKLLMGCSRTFTRNITEQVSNSVPCMFTLI